VLIFRANTGDLIPSTTATHCMVFDLGWAQNRAQSTTTFAKNPIHSSENRRYLRNCLSARIGAILAHNLVEARIVNGREDTLTRAILGCMYLEFFLAAKPRICSSLCPLGYWRCESRSDLKGYYADEWPPTCACSNGGSICFLRGNTHDIG
jgi:hypothetical protein